MHIRKLRPLHSCLFKCQCICTSAQFAGVNRLRDHSSGIPRINPDCETADCETADGAARLANRAGLPVLLAYLGVGLLLGEDGLGLGFDNHELAHDLTHHPVSRDANSVRNTGPQLIEPVTLG